MEEVATAFVFGEDASEGCAWLGEADGVWGNNNSGY